MKGEGHMARMGSRRSAYRVLLGELRERDHLEDPELDGSFILRCIFSRNGMGHGLDRSSPEKEQITCCCECGNEGADPIKQGNFLNS
jgi:hypothetical protein